MARSFSLLGGAVVRIRPYRQEDEEDVIRIFSAGMMGLANLGGTAYLLQNNRPLFLLSVAAPAAALFLTPRRCHLATKVVASLGAAALLPCLAFGLLRNFIREYVKHSVSGPDLSNIETFYSTTGSGHGSAFWVAEVVEPESGVAALPQRPMPRSTIAAVAFPAKDALLAGAASDGVPIYAISGSAARKLERQEAPPREERANKPFIPGTEGGFFDSHAASELTNPMESLFPETAGSSADAGDESHIRTIVAGLVRTAIAKLEGAALAPVTTSAPPPASAAAANAAPRPICVRGAPKPNSDALQCPDPDSKAEDAGSESDVQALEAAAVAAPAPGTPSAAARPPRIGSFAQPTVQMVRSAATAAGAAALATVDATEETSESEALPPPPVRRHNIIGHVALERKSWKVAELRRMSVLKQYAGQGVGHRLLDTAVQHARDNGFRELVLQTTGMQPAARRLYERGGWRVTGVVRDEGVEIFTYTLDLTRRA